MSSGSKDNADVATGILLILSAGFFGWQTAGLKIGTALNMGPGYYPMVLCGLLFVLGLVILLKGLKGPASEPIGAFALRGMLFILPAPIFFGLTVRGLGFVPSIFFTALIAAFASRKMKPLQALMLALLVAVFSTLVFSYGLKLPMRRFGPWLPF